MNSCLGDTDARFSDTSVCYVTMDSYGIVYGRTTSGLFITSQSMSMQLSPGDIKWFSYTWEEAYGTTAISINGQTYTAYNVVINSDVNDVPESYLDMSDAPAQADPSKFLELQSYYYDEYGNYLNDKWVIAYACKLKKGEQAQVSFYKAAETSTYNGRDVINIDVRLHIAGTAEGTTTTSESDLIAVDMSQLRALIMGGSSSGTETKYIRFRYYRENYNDLYTSSDYYPMTKISN